MGTVSAKNPGNGVASGLSHQGMYTGGISLPETNRKMKYILLAIAFPLFLFSSCAPGRKATAKNDKFHPGLTWLDDKGNPINAHGGGVLYEKGIYCWYGEHKLPGRSEKQLADGGVHCYSSRDLYNWKDEGLVLSVDHENAASDIAAGCILERPKVIYNERTKKYMMYFKLYPRGTGYERGFVGVASASSPKGPFTYSHRFLGADSEKGSGDFTMFKDINGDLLHFTVRKPDRAFCVGKLNETYTQPGAPYKVLTEIPVETEAPALFVHEGRYYMLGSGSSGWTPNAARAFNAPSVTGPYQQQDNPCEGVNPHNQLDKEKTFGGQISFVLPVQGYKDAYIALFDSWNPEKPIEGGYIWLPVRIGNGKITIQWRDQWDLSVFDR